MVLILLVALAASSRSRPYTPSSGIYLTALSNLFAVLTNASPQAFMHPRCYPHPKRQGDQDHIHCWLIHLDSIARGAHLLQVFDGTLVPDSLHYSQTLDMFCAFYVNEYIDHHAFEILF
jgi:hypothetical protein